MYLSKDKIESLRKELQILEHQIHEHHSGDATEGTMGYSFNDAANSDIQIKPKVKRAVIIKQILKEAKILEKSASNTVQIGSVVDIKDEKNNILQVQIVSSVEASPLEQKISNESPLGSSLLGKKKGDKVALNGKDYKVVKIK